MDHYRVLAFRHTIFALTAPRSFFDFGLFCNSAKIYIFFEVNNNKKKIQQNYLSPKKSLKDQEYEILPELSIPTRFRIQG